MDKKREIIILVDDNMANLTMGRNMLKTFYEVYPAPSVGKLFEILENVFPDLILLDIAMPDCSGYEVIKKLKGDPRYCDIPVIFLTAKNDESSEIEGFELGAVDYITKPFSAPLLLKRIANQLLIVQQKTDLLSSQAKLKDYADNLEVKIREKTAEVIGLQSAVLATVIDMVEFRDKNTSGHIARTQIYLKALIDGMIAKGVYKEEIDGWNIELFLYSALLHDLGKLGITDLILNKTDKLSPEEFDVMKTHVAEGMDAIDKIMKEIKGNLFLQHAMAIAGTHHEKWDGTGYPNGLKGADIPLEGRLMAIADVYDALISERPYKNVFSHVEASKIIEAGSGTQFDPALVEVFIDVKDKFAEAAERIHA